jgi:hypothetical protein
MKKIGVILTFLFFFLINISPVFAARGCCSWHGGVDYCDTKVGRYVCNDGTYSPSCGCYREPKSEPTREHRLPTSTPEPYYDSTPTDMPYTASSVDSSSGGDSTDSTAGFLIFGGFGALALLMMGAVVNFFRKPTAQDRRFIDALMAAQNHHYAHDKTRMVTSDFYLEWARRVDAVDNAVCHALNITPYQYADLIRRPSIKLLYKREAKRREREENKSKNDAWYFQPINWFLALLDHLELKSEENIFYKIVLYPILLLVGFGMMLFIPLGFLLLYVIIISPIILAGYLAESLGWVSAILIGGGIYLMACWVLDKKKNKK